MVAPVSNRSRLAGVSFLLFCFSLLLISYSRKNTGVAGVGAAWLAELESPLQLASHGAYRGIADVWSNYIDLISVRKELLEVQRRLVLLEAENSALLEFENENQRLRDLLGVSKEQNLGGIAAEVIGYNPSAWIKAVTLNKGSNDGIEVGMPVLAGTGLVGQIISVASHVSRALLIIDHGSGVDVIVQGGRSRGVIAGAQESSCEMRYVSREEQINVGDRIITSGMDGVYPKGLFVGIVSDLQRSDGGLFLDLSVKPAVDFSKLETVLIAKSNSLAAQKELEEKHR